jgi:hypothetical protein
MLFLMGAIVLGTYAFSACGNKSGSESEGTVVDSDTVVETQTDTTVTETRVETDTVTSTTTTGGTESKDTTNKQ